MSGNSLIYTKMMCQEIAPFALYCKDVLGNSSIYTQMMCQKIALFALQRCVRKQLHLHSNDVPGNSSICTLIMCQELLHLHSIIICQEIALFSL